MRVLLIVSLLLSGATCLAQTWELPRLEWGDPDFEGVWLSENAAAAPFQRPLDERDETLLRELVDGGVVEAGLINEGVVPEARVLERLRALTEWRRSNFGWTSLVVDPADGRLPAQTAASRDRAGSAWRSTVSTTGPWNSAADLGPVERCISRGTLRSMLPAFDYHGTEIVQAPGLVVIRTEAIHETRVIPLDDRPALPPGIRGYMGNARGRWDGDTLVVETTNFNGKTGASLNGNELPTSPSLRLVEHFSRVAAATIEYSVTVSDPETWSAPWTVTFPLRLDAGYLMSEYACHEGNYALRGILSAARAAEKSRR